MQGRNAEALADDDMAIRLDPKHPLGYVNRGQTLSNLGDRVAALASIDRAMQLAPGFPPALDLLKKIGTGGQAGGGALGRGRQAEIERVFFGSPAEIYTPCASA